MYFGPTSDTSKILGNTKNQLTAIFNQINSALDPMIDAWAILEAQQQSETQT